MSEKLTIGDKLLATIANRMFRGTNLDSLNAGATINGATLPVPVYQNATDNELYACDANDLAALNFIGFGISNSTDGNPIDFQRDGIVKGFTGLTEGTRYYVQDAVGTIGTTPGTYKVLVGIAISETELLIMRKPRYRAFTGTRVANAADASVNYAHGLGITPTKIKITAFTGNNGGVVMHSSGVKNDGVYSCIYLGGQSTGTPSANTTTSYIVYILNDDAAHYARATVTVDATNVTLAWVRDSETGLGAVNIGLLFEVWED